MCVDGSGRVVPGHTITHILILLLCWCRSCFYQKVILPSNLTPPVSSFAANLCNAQVIVQLRIWAETQQRLVVIGNQCGWSKTRCQTASLMRMIVCDDPAGLNHPHHHVRCSFSVRCRLSERAPFLPQRASSSSSAMTDRKAVIKNADMSEDMQQDAVDCATQAMEKYNIEKDIAAYIKKVRQDGCMDGSERSPASLHHVHMICKFWAVFILWSIFGQCGDEALMIRAVARSLFYYRGIPQRTTFMNLSVKTTVSTSVWMFHVQTPKHQNLLVWHLSHRLVLLKVLYRWLTSRRQTCKSYRYRQVRTKTESIETLQKTRKWLNIERETYLSDAIPKILNLFYY